MRARYIGDPRRDGHGPSIITMFGLSFRKGEWVNVAGNPHAMKKLPTNTHFEVDRTKAAPTRKAAAPAATAPVAPVVEASEIDPIPDDWKDKHHSTRMKWATQISGFRPGSAVEADGVIAAHLAAPAPAKPAVDDDDGFSDLDPDV